jgi:hypothetical protein
MRRPCATSSPAHTTWKSRNPDYPLELAFTLRGPRSVGMRCMQLDHELRVLTGQPAAQQPVHGSGLCTVSTAATAILSLAKRIAMVLPLKQSMPSRRQTTNRAAPWARMRNVPSSARSTSSPLPGSAARRHQPADRAAVLDVAVDSRPSAGALALL